MRLIRLEKGLSIETAKTAEELEYRATEGEQVKASELN